MKALDNDGLAHLWAGLKTKLALKADVASPTFTGTPKAPTAANGTSTTQIASTAFVDGAIGIVKRDFGVAMDGLSEYVIGEANAYTDTVASGLFDKIYPVGAIYLSTSSASPSSLFGGTWTRIKDTFLLSAGDTYGAGTTGGEATHTLSTDEMPPHTHAIPTRRVASGSSGIEAIANTTAAQSASSTVKPLTDNGPGTSTPFSIMPPYLSVYVWKRTA